MKTITGITSLQMDTPAAGNITVVLNYGDQEFTSHAKGQTVPETIKSHPRFSRSHRVTDMAYFVMRYTPKGFKGIAMLHCVMAKLAVALENCMTWTPIFTKQPQSQTVEINSPATFTVETCGEELHKLETTYEWFESKDGKETNGSLADGGIYGGTKTASLVVTPTDITKSGFLYACVATNGAGSTNSSPAQLAIKAPQPPTVQETPK
jgi:hypothetical protein